MNSELFKEGSSLYYKPIGFNEIDNCIILEIPIKFLSKDYMQWWKNNKSKIEKERLLKSRMKPKIETNHIKEVNITKIEDIIEMRTPPL